MDSNTVGMLKAILSGAWQAPQTILGVATAAKRGLGKPAFIMNNGEPRLEYTARPGDLPIASGQAQILPPGVDPVSRAHENVHSEQSLRYGPAFEVLNLLGALTSTAQMGDPDMDHPLEDEAYLRTEPSQGLSDRLAMKRAMRRY